MRRRNNFSSVCSSVNFVKYSGLVLFCFIGPTGEIVTLGRQVRLCIPWNCCLLIFNPIALRKGQNCIQFWPFWLQQGYNGTDVCKRKVTYWVIHFNGTSAEWGCFRSNMVERNVFVWITELRFKCRRRCLLRYAFQWYVRRLCNSCKPWCSKVCIKKKKLNLSTCSWNT